MLTIIIDSFDGYSDLWPSFFEIFRKQWSDCPYDIKLVSNEKTFDGVETICVGEETCWSERTLKAVSQITTDYVLLLLEDYFFGEKVKNEDIEKIVSFIREQNAKYMRLTNIPESRFSKGDEIFPLYEDEEYAVNLQAAIWEKDFLIESLKKFPGNAWDFEVGFLKNAVCGTHKEMVGCFGVLKDPLNIRNGVLKGKWFPSEIKFFTENGFNISWQQRGKLSGKQVLKYKLSIGLKNKISYKTRKRLKKILKKFGIKFVSDL